MKQKSVAAKSVNRQKYVARLFVMCFLAASLITALQIAHAASPCPRTRCIFSCANFFGGTSACN